MGVLLLIPRVMSTSSLQRGGFPDSSAGKDRVFCSFPFPDPKKSKQKTRCRGEVKRKLKVRNCHRGCMVFPDKSLANRNRRIFRREQTLVCKEKDSVQKERQASLN